MVLLDGYTLSPPEPKTTTVEVPGRDGVLDLTESLIGDVTYGNRSMTFTFLIVDLEQFEVVKTQVSNALHGRKFNFEMTMDPGYTYTGRFKINSYTHTATWSHGICGFIEVEIDALHGRKFNFEMTMDPGYTYTGRFKINSYTHTATWSHGICGFIEVEIDADPYKLKSHYVYNLNATGGMMFQLPSGRKKVHPIIDLKSPARIRWKNVVYRVGAGRFQLNDVLFEEGLNDIYINSYELRNFTWAEWPPIGKAKIRIRDTSSRGGTLVLCSDELGWTYSTGAPLESEGDDYYSYTFDIDHDKFGQPITYYVIRIPSEYVGNGSDLPHDVETPRSIILSHRKVYSSDIGNSDVIESWIDNSDKATWNEFRDIRWDDLQKTEGLVKDVRQKWGDFSTIKWSNLGVKRWKECDFRIEGAPETIVTLEFDWKDL